MTEQQRQEWNRALELGDEVTIKRLQTELLYGIHTRIMDEDINYQTAGWKRRG